MEKLPDDVRAFLLSLDRNYEEVFMQPYTSPCATCNGGKMRMVHRSAEMHRIGASLKELLSRHKVSP